MSLKGKAFIAGAYEHPARELPDTSLEEIHADVIFGALADAGLELRDVDGFFCDSDVPGRAPWGLAEYLGLKLTYIDSSELGGTTYIAQVGHAAAAIAAGKCRIAVVTLAGRPRSGRKTARKGSANGPLKMPEEFTWGSPGSSFEVPYGAPLVAQYALAASRHMHEFGTTSADLAEIKVAASLHAQHNPHAFLRNPVTVEEVLASPMVSDPLHKLDCCVVTDGGGAIVVVAPEIARDLDRRTVRLLGHGEFVKHSGACGPDLISTGAAVSGPLAFAEAGLSPQDIQYVSIYDSFTITVLETLEDLGFCAKGRGGRFVRDGALQSPHGQLPFNTDGGGLCNNHPANRGGMTKILEAVRQLRGEAHPAVQVPGCALALAHGTGGMIATRSCSSTILLGAEEG